jgi:hypothetical protein
VEDELIEGELVVAGRRLRFFFILSGGLLGGIELIVGLFGLFAISLIDILGPVVLVRHFGLLVDPVFDKLDEEGCE